MFEVKNARKSFYILLFFFEIVETVDQSDLLTSRFKFTHYNCLVPT